MPSPSVSPIASPSPEPVAEETPGYEGRTRATRYATEAELGGALGEALGTDITCVDSALVVTCATADLLIEIDAQTIALTGEAVGDYTEGPMTSFLVEEVTAAGAIALVIGPGWFAKIKSLSAQIDQPDLDDIADGLAEDLGAFGRFDTSDDGIDRFFAAADHMRVWDDYSGPSVEIS